MTYPLINDWTAYVPPVHFGAGRSAETADLLKAKGLQNLLVVTDPGVRSQPFFDSFIATLDQQNVKLSLFSDIRSNPTSDSVAACAEVYLASGCEGIVAIGGGSAIDVAKAVSLTANNGISLWEFCQLENPDLLPKVEGDNFFVPLMIIPTTAGTGSELSGSFCVITDIETHRKRVAFHTEHFPFAIIDDPQLLTGLPTNLTAWTGMDALTHALEAYAAPSYNPLCDGIALEAIRLCEQWLETSFKDGQNAEARAHMMSASSIAAVAFSSKGLGAVHSMAHAVGALFDTHHGLANAVLLPYVLEHNKAVIEEKLTTVARLLDLEEHSPDGVIAWLLQLRKSLSIPETLADLGIERSALGDIAQASFQDAEHQTNPVAMTEADFMAIAERAFDGYIC